MPQIKSKIENKTTSWESWKRFRVNDTCEHNGNTYVNLTGGNSEPGVGEDWIKQGANNEATENAVLYTPQNTTPGQQQAAQTNIGVDDYQDPLTAYQNALN